MYLSIDVETGGKDGDLLSFALIKVLPDFKMNISDFLHEFVKRDYYKVSHESLELTGITTNDLHYGKTPKELGTIIYSNLSYWSRCGQDKLIPVGFGLAGDVQRIFELISPGSWYNFVSYNGIELSSIATLLRINHPAIPNSLDKLATYLGVERNESSKLHNAFYDAALNVGVLQQFANRFNFEY